MNNIRKAAKSPHLLCFWILLALMTGTVPASAGERQNPEQTWGVAVTVRNASIVFATDDESVSSFVPLLYYQGEHFFMDGTEGGVTAWKGKMFHFDLLGRLRFFDIPESYQNEIQGDTIDLGARLGFTPHRAFSGALDVLSDELGHIHSNLRFNYTYSTRRLDLEPFVNIRYSTSDFNSYYFGLDRQNIDSGTDVSLGLSFRYQLYQNLWAIGSAQLTWLSDSVTDSPYVDRETAEEIYLGIAFFNEDREVRKPNLSIKPYLRVAHGWATPSNIGDIISFNTEPDPDNNQLSSLFYGHPLTDELFGFPLAIYLTPGFVHHWSSEVQETIQEYVLAIKAYCTFTWPVKWRFGAAEGVSYVSDIPHVEASEMERKGYEPSNLMNYLDFSIDVDLGDLFNSPSLQGLYFGYSIHHRSAIFESAAQFGRISGGANFNTIYLQYHF